MKRKIISNTYLRDVDSYRFKLFLDEDKWYVSVKKLIHVREKFIIKHNVCVMDDGYYVLEVVPKRENYAMRLFLDSEKRPLEYYFDICKNNGLDKDSNIPCYDDLYLDITYLNGEISVIDEDELMDAYHSGDISDDDLELVYRIRDLLLKEIKDGTNEVFNIDYRKYLDEF